MKPEMPPEWMTNYNRLLEKLERNPQGFLIFREPQFDLGVHPENFIDFECAFAAHHLRQGNPRSVLDIGSYRQFIFGLLAHFQVTTIDVRSRTPISGDEAHVTGDAKNLHFPDGSFDAVVSLCALEHFGLGRYGDEIDLQADQKAFGEMVRVLKPAGLLLFSTTISRAHPSIAFNAHRIYDHAMIRRFCAGLICGEEKFYSHRKKGFCPLEEVTAEPEEWDVYCGCWRKRGS